VSGGNAIDGLVKLPGESGVFVRQFKVRHEPDMGSLMVFMNLIEQQPSGER
jgi:hypothetical protein